MTELDFYLVPEDAAPRAVDREWLGRLGLTLVAHEPHGLRVRAPEATLQELARVGALGPDRWRVAVDRPGVGLECAV
jgi:hypothetical protein